MRPLLLLILFLLGNIWPSQASPQWKQRADFGSFGRHRGTGVGVGNKAYVGTGHLNGTGFDTWYGDWWEYDPATNAWVQKADYPGNFGMGDQDIVSINLGDFAFAGLGQLDGNSFYKYDPQTNIWTQVSSPPISLSFNNTFPFEIGTDGFFPALFSNQFYKYDSLLDTWTLINVLPFSTTWGLQCISINGKGYIKNGYFMYEYDPVMNSFTPKPPYPGSTPERPRVFRQNGQAFFIGGMDATWTWGSEVWRYNPADESWLQLEDFPGTTRRWAVALNIGNRAYFGIGTNGTNFHDWWEFDALAHKEELSSNKITAYPNPASESIVFEYENQQNFRIDIYNALGELIRSKKTSNGSIKFTRAQEPSGTYIYHVIVNGQIVSSEEIVLI